MAVRAYRAFDPAISGDYVAHLDYLRYIETRHALPRADQGFEMYHPPLYYLTTVVLHTVVRLFATGFSLTDAGRTGR